MKWLRYFLTAVGVIGLALAIMPYYRVSTLHLADGATETRRVFTLGFPASPFLRVRSFDTKPGPGIVQPDGSVTFKGPSSERGSSLQFVSWSMLSLILGGVFLDGGRSWPGIRKSLLGR